MGVGTQWGGLPVLVPVRCLRTDAGVFLRSYHFEQFRQNLNCFQTIQKVEAGCENISLRLARQGYGVHLHIIR